jgi:hypothetical protein
MGIDFRLSEEQIALRDGARSFAREVLKDVRTTIRKYAKPDERFYAIRPFHKQGVAHSISQWRRKNCASLTSTSPAQCLEPASASSPSSCSGPTSKSSASSPISSKTDRISRSDRYGSKRLSGGGGIKHGEVVDLAATCIFSFAASTSRSGGVPNIRLYFRVNCGTLS